MIERIQKQYIIEDAIKQGIYTSDIVHIPQVIQQLLGNTDYSYRKYGVPLAPTYTANVDEQIDISKIISFFSGLKRDHQVLESSINEVETLITHLSNSISSKEEMIKIRTSNLQKFASANGLSNANKANWIFTETFHDLSTIDTVNSTLWVDTKEGVCYIPDKSSDNIIPPAKIKLANYSMPTGCNFLGTSPTQSFDGSTSTGWKVYLVSDVSAQCVVSFDPTNITYISFDPIGFGNKIVVEAYTDTWKTIIQDVIYSRTTFPVGLQNVTQIRITLSNGDSTLPKVIGLGNVTFFTSDSNKFGSVYSTELTPDKNFTNVKLTLDADIPTGAIVNAFYSVYTPSNPSASSMWIPIKPDVWDSYYTNKYSSTLYSLNNSTQVIGDEFRSNFLTNSSLINGLYNYTENALKASPALSASNGTIALGVDQIEVSASRVDHSILGEFPHNPIPQDIANGITKTTWNTPGNLVAVSGLILAQPYGADLSASVNFNNSIVRQRLVDSTSFPYGDLTIIPLVGSSAYNPMQYGYVYSFKCQIYSLKQQIVNIGKYWFLQGYRKSSNKTTYRQLGKSYGAFNLFINGVKVAGDTRPYTIFDGKDSNLLGTPSYSTSDLENGATEGVDFSFSLIPGWNTIELYVSLNDPAISYSGVDNNETLAAGGSPYMQLSLYPNFFNKVFQSDYFITDVVGSGEIPPIDQFDLMWNVPKNLKYWSWDPFTLNTLLFSSISLPKIDNFYQGEYPNHRLSYQGFGVNNPGAGVQNIKVRLDCYSSSVGNISPLVHNYNLMVS